MYYLLEYDYVIDILERRDAFRDEHLSQAQRYYTKNNLHMAGATGQPVSGAMFIFKNLEVTEIEAFVATDPYVKNSLVTNWRITPWTVVIGT